MASTNLATFSPQDVTISIVQASTGLNHNISGYAEDSFVTVERNSETFDMYTGADETYTRVYKPDTSAAITVSLQQTSNSNDILSLLYANDKAARNSTGLFSILIKDNSGRSTYFAAEAYIGVVPNSEFGNTMKTREWVIHAPRMDQYIGGNSKISPEDLAAVGILGGAIADSFV